MKHYLNEDGSNSENKEKPNENDPRSRREKYNDSFDPESVKKDKDKLNS